MAFKLFGVYLRISRDRSGLLFEYNLVHFSFDFLQKNRRDRRDVRMMIDYVTLIFTGMTQQELKDRVEISDEEINVQ